MALLCRLKQLKLNQHCYQFKRFYGGFCSPCLHNHVAAAHSIAEITNSSCQFIHRRQIELFDSVRFFAVPVQQLKKEVKEDPKELRLNEKIPAFTIRLVTEEGHSVMLKRDALEQAKSLDLDLVEVDRGADPPVCKIMDYNRERYKKHQLEKERAKSKAKSKLRIGDAKELRFLPKTEEKDLQVKANTAKKLMERGYRVRLVVSGNEHQDLGGLLGRVSAMIDDIAIVESGPRVEKKQAFVVVRHIKYGPTKKGVKKSIKDIASSIQTLRAGGSEAEADSQDSGMDNDDDTDANDDLPDVFDVKQSHSFPDARMMENSFPPRNTNASAPNMPNLRGPNSNPASSQPAPHSRYQQNVANGPRGVDSGRFANYGSQPRPGFNAPPSMHPNRRGCGDESAENFGPSHPPRSQHGSPNFRPPQPPHAPHSQHGSSNFRPPHAPHSQHGSPNFRPHQPPHPQHRYESNGNRSFPPGGTRIPGNSVPPRNEAPKQEKQQGPTDGDPAPKRSRSDFGIFSIPKN